MSARNPTFAGSFYDSDFSNLNKEIEESFTAKLGPGSLPSKRKKQTFDGIIVPHAGYIYSGPCAAWAYKEIAESKLKDTYIIIGQSHQGGIPTNISDVNWKTPLGIISNDREFGVRIAETLKLPLAGKESEFEHTIEVQLPFLQYALKDKLDKIRIVPIILGEDINLEKIKELSQTIKSIGQTLNRDFGIIASSDFIHYGPNYGYQPFAYNIKENIESLNNEAFNLIEHGSPEEFLKFIRTKDPSICGYNAIALAMEINKNSKHKKILQNYDSSKISEDEENFVSYASFLFK